MIYHFVYKTICTITGKYYIGVHSTNDLNDSYLGSGLMLRISIDRFGEENHRRIILQQFQTREGAMDKEKELVNETTLKDPLCLNLHLGGLGGWPLHSSLSEESLERKRKGQKLGGLNSVHNLSEWRESTGYFNGFKGKRHTAETKAVIGAKNSNAVKGPANGSYGTNWFHSGSIEQRFPAANPPKDWTRGRLKKSRCMQGYPT